MTEVRYSSRRLSTAARDGLAVQSAARIFSARRHQCADEWTATGRAGEGADPWTCRY